MITAVLQLAFVWTYALFDYLCSELRFLRKVCLGVFSSVEAACRKFWMKHTRRHTHKPTFPALILLLFLSTFQPVWVICDCVNYGCMSAFCDSILLNPCISVYGSFSFDCLLQWCNTQPGRWKTQRSWMSRLKSFSYCSPPLGQVEDKKWLQHGKIS